MAHDHEPNPVSPLSPGGREMLTVAEFDRAMKARDLVAEAKWSEFQTLITTGFREQTALHEATQNLQRKTNGRLLEAESELKRLGKEGCSRFEAHKAMFDAIEDPEQPRRRRLHQRPVVQIGGSLGLGAALVEIVKFLSAHWK